MLARPGTLVLSHADAGGSRQLRRLEMVANRYGITLLPEMAIASEIHTGGDIRLLRFRAPEPKREIGLAWRKTSPRKADFIQFAELLRDVTPRSGTQALK